MAPVVKTARSIEVKIFIAGDADRARISCRAYCDEVGLCVTITPTLYAYTGGEEGGVIIGLINYPRFPATVAAIYAHAEALAEKLRHDLGQDSYTIMGPLGSSFVSYRDADQ